MGPVNVILRNKPFYEPLPTGKAGEPPKRAGMPEIKKAGEGEGEERVLSMREMTDEDATAVAEQALTVCEVAEAIDSDAADPLKEWLTGVEQRDMHEAVLGPVRKAVAAAGSPNAFKDLTAEMGALLKQDWECEDLEPILAKKPGGAAAPPPE
jgi:hypothetical protein